MIKALKHLDGFCCSLELKIENILKSTVKLYYFLSKKWPADKSVSAQEVSSTFSLFLSKIGKNRKHLMSFEIISILM